MWWKLNTKEIQHSGSDQRLSMLETWTAKTNLAESSRGSVSDSRRPLARRSLSLWLKDKMIKGNKLDMP